MNGIYLILLAIVNGPLDLPKRIAETGPIDSAIMVIDHIIDSARGTPLEAHALLLKANIYRQIGDDGRALTVLQGMRRMELPDDVADTVYSILADMASDPRKQASILSEFVSKYPFASTRLNALWQLADLFEFLNMPDSAMMAFKRIAADYPSVRDTAQVEIGRLRLETGNPGRAIVLARRHLQRIPRAHYVLSLAQLAKGDTGLAIALSWDIAKSDPYSAALMLDLMHRRDASSIALQLLPEWKTELDTWPLELKVAWARAMVDIGMADEVFHLLGPPIFSADSLKPYRTLLNFRFYILSGQLDSAVVIVDSLPPQPPFSGYIVDFASNLMRRGYVHEALPILERVYSHGQYYPMDRLLKLLRTGYLKLENYESAAQIEKKMVMFGVPVERPITKELERQADAFRRLFEATGDSIYLENARKLRKLLKGMPQDSVTKRIEALIQDGRYEEAFREVDLNRYDLLYRIALGILEQGDTMQAYSILGLIPPTGFKLDHDAFVLRLKLAYALGKFQRVEDDFSKNSGFYMDFRADTALWRVVGLAEMALGRYSEALGWLYPLEDTALGNIIATAFCKLDMPEMALSIHSISNETAVKCALKMGDLAKLKSLNPPLDRQLLRNYLIAIAKDNPDYAMKLADSLRVSYIIKSEIAVIKALNESDVEKAIENAATPLSYYEIGLFFMRRGMLDSAKVYFRKAMENLENPFPLAAFKLGTIYYSKDMATEAVKYYKMAMSDDSLRPYAIYNLASAFKTLRKKDSAAFYYRLLMKEYADREISLEAEDALAFMLQDGGKPMEALHYWNDLEGELKSFEDEIELKYWKAEALFALNRSREALNYYLMVANSETSSEWRIIAMLKAAKIYAIIGQKSRAVALYRKVLKMAGETSQFGEIARQELDALQNAGR